VKARFVVSVEHATRRVPARYRRLIPREILAGHRGWDPGALRLGEELARTLQAPLLAAGASRLLVDANRSLGHRGSFSRWTRGLGADERNALIARYWEPFRSATRRAIDDIIRSHARAVHLSCHSFTPVFEGTVRNVDLGLLFDPARKAERELAGKLRRALGNELPALRVRFNQPYRGVTDGHTSGLRRELSGRVYSGLEIEVSQAIVADPKRFRELRGALGRALSRSARD
jgi:predicted N-formylglutamate amidohydrolase